MLPVPAKSAAPAWACPSPNILSKFMAAASGSRAKWARARSFISQFPFSIGVLLCALRGSPCGARLWRKPLPTLSPAVLSIFTLLLTNCNHFQATILLTSGSVTSALRSERGLMAATAGLTEVVLYDTLVNYLVSMARTVEGAMNRALDAIVSLENPRTSVLPGEVFLLEPRINEMEIVIDEHAIRLLRRGSFSDDEMRLIVAALKITNDLERIGDLAVNLAECVVSLREMQGAQVPEELAPMASAVRAMVSKSLGALIFRNIEMATQVLESDDVVDQYRDRIFEQLLQGMTQEPALVSPGLQFILATRHLERIADHATNIAEDIIFWVRGLDVRRRRGLAVLSEPSSVPAADDSNVTQNSHSLHSDVTPVGNTEQA